MRHGGQVLPPQSTAVSLPSCTPFRHDAGGNGCAGGAEPSMHVGPPDPPPGKVTLTLARELSRVSTVIEMPFGSVNVSLAPSCASEKLRGDPGVMSSKLGLTGQQTPPQKYGDVATLIATPR